MQSIIRRYRRTIHSRTISVRLFFCTRRAKAIKLDASFILAFRANMLSMNEKKGGLFTTFVKDQACGRPKSTREHSHIGFGI